MTQQAAGYEDSDIPLESGRLRVRRWGAADAPTVVCVPGLSANLCGFDRLAERLAGETLQLVAIDLRGRGRSEVTGAGTYGWRSHARDVLGIADAVGAPSFAVIGQSSGAAIAMTCAQLAPSRVGGLVLVDLVGSPDERSGVPVVASISRLGTVYPSAQAAIALIKQIGIIPEWDEYWDRYFQYELRDVNGGVASGTDRGAVLEDLGYGNAMYWPGPEAPIHTLWDAITMPALAQAQTVARRVREADLTWTELDQIVSDRDLPDRVIDAMFDAVLGYRVRRATYLKRADITEQTATRDLAVLASEGILNAHGNGRGRYYTAGEPLRQIQERRRARRTPLRDPYPWMRAKLSEPIAQRAASTQPPDNGRSDGCPALPFGRSASTGALRRSGWIRSHRAIAALAAELSSAGRLPSGWCDATPPP